MLNPTLDCIDLKKSLEYFNIAKDIKSIVHSYVLNLSFPRFALDKAGSLDACRPGLLQALFSPSRILCSKALLPGIFQLLRVDHHPWQRSFYSTWLASQAGISLASLVAQAVYVAQRIYEAYILSRLFAMNIGLLTLLFSCCSRVFACLLSLGETRQDVQCNTRIPGILSAACVHVTFTYSCGVFSTHAVRCPASFVCPRREVSHYHQPGSSTDVPMAEVWDGYHSDSDTKDLQRTKS